MASGHLAGTRYRMNYHSDAGGPPVPLLGDIEENVPYNFIVTQALCTEISNVMCGRTWVLTLWSTSPLAYTLTDTQTKTRVGMLKERSAWIPDQGEAVAATQEPAERPCKGCGRRDTGVFVRTAFVCSECNYLLGGF